MPKIIKSFNWDAESCPEYFINRCIRTPVTVPTNGSSESDWDSKEYHLLTDDEQIFIAWKADKDSDLKNGWYATRFIPNPDETERKNPYMMFMNCSDPSERTEAYKTKKALYEAIENSSIEFVPTHDRKPFIAEGAKELRIVEERRTLRKGESRQYDDVATEEDVLALGREMESHSQDLKSPLKNPWLIPAVLLVGTFIAVVVFSN